MKVCLIGNNLTTLSLAKNLVNKRFDDFKVIKPNFIEIEYEHNTETIICKDWCVDNE